MQSLEGSLGKILPMVSCTQRWGIQGEDHGEKRVSWGSDQGHSAPGAYHVKTVLSPQNP